MAKVFNVICGWPLLLAYDLNRFNISKQHMIYHSGITKKRFEAIIRDKEATIEELDKLTFAFNKIIVQISEIDENIKAFEENFLTDNQ